MAQSRFSFEPAPNSVCQLCSERPALRTVDAFAVCGHCYHPPEFLTPDERCFLLSIAINGVEPEPAAVPAELVTIGTNERNQPVTLDLAARNRHVYAIGRTGSGKSSLLRNLIMQDMNAGRGVIFLDPHGDTAQQLLGYVPSSRLDEVIYFCPTDPACPSFNLLATDYPPDKLTRDMVSAVKMFFGDSWGPRLEQLLTNALLTLLLDRVHEPHSFADLQRILIDAEYRAAIVERCANRSLITFWTVTFPTMGKDAVNPVLNKLSQLLMPTSPMERIFSATGNALDIGDVMNSGKILLCNLAKGELGEAGAFLIGGLITTAIAQAALARTRIPEHERRDVFFYVDEFQHFAIDSFESILSEARKYRLNLTLAHQYLDQVPSNLQAAIFGNVAVTICLPISAADAATMRREMSHQRIFGLEQSRTHGINFLRRCARETLAGQPGFQFPQHPFCADANGRQLPPSPFWYPFVWRRYREWVHDVIQIWRATADFHAGRAPWTPVIKNYANSPAQLAAGHKEEWPQAQDFKLLSPLNGFVKINSADNVHRFTVHHPTEKPRAEISRAILTRQREQHEREQHEEKRRSQMPQDARTRSGTTEGVDLKRPQALSRPPREPDDFGF